LLWLVGFYEASEASGDFWFLEGRYLALCLGCSVIFLVLLVVGLVVLVFEVVDVFVKIGGLSRFGYLSGFSFFCVLL
jgi:hypothetical protein